MRSLGFAVALLALGAAGAALAQTPAPASPAPTMDKAAMSKACSAQADQKGLHGKARKKFRSQCRHGQM